MTKTWAQSLAWSRHIFPAVLRHATVVSFRKKRAATPLEYLGLFGVYPYPPFGKRESHLVNVVKSLTPRQAISRIGNGVSPRCFFLWMLYCFANTRRRQEATVQIHPLTAEESEPSDEEVDLVNISCHDEDDLLRGDMNHDSPRTPFSRRSSHHVLTPPP